MRNEFYDACERGDVEIVQELLANPQTEVNKPNSSLPSFTPFYTACWNGHDKVVSLLLKDERVDVANADDNGRYLAPFYVACKNGYDKVVSLLLKDERIDVTKEDHEGRTPFFMACLLKHDKVISMLVKSERIDIAKADKDGRTPFYILKNNPKFNVIVSTYVSARLLSLSGELIAGKKEQAIKNSLPKESQSNNAEYIRQFRAQFETAIDSAQKVLKNDKTWNEKLAGKVFCGVLFSDDYYRLKPLLGDDPKEEKNARKFFEALKKLPIELQMLICNLVVENNKKFVSTNAFNEALSEEVRRPGLR